MSALTRPRGPLPPRVYWTRRIMVLGTALVLAVALGMSLSRLSDGSGSDGAVTPAASGRSPGATGSADSTGSEDEKDKKGTKDKKRKKHKKPDLPEPSGPCLASDIDVTPVVKDAVAGRDVRLRFRIVTRMSLACTWQASPDTLTLKITSGRDLIWTSQQCLRAVPTKDLVLRRSKASWLSMTWSAKRSDEECSRTTEWAMPGWYHVAVAPLGGEPEDVQFKLSRPEAEVVTAPDKGDKKGDKKGDDKQGGTKGDQKNDTNGGAGGEPSGAVEPNG